MNATHLKGNNLVGAEQLHGWLSTDEVCVFDCRFDLSAPDRGRELWLEAHIPGAHYADLDRDLSSPPTDGSGRHPLPDPKEFAAFLAQNGWTPGHRVVAYDDIGGALAARLWFLMRYFGQQGAAVLDGGLQAWREAGLPMEGGPSTAAPAAPVELAPELSMVTDTVALQRQLERERVLLIDARAANRFAGRDENLDPVAGHVPGAINRPFADNLGDRGRFRSVEALESEYRRLLGAREPSETVHMCGSGVTACHNLLAMELAGLTGARLYAGSWSEWIRDPTRPVAEGPA